MIRIATAGLALALLAGPVGPARAQDAAAGEKAFAKCRVCHQVGPTAKNVVGPKLNGLFGRAAGTIEGFRYSDANKNSGITWTPESFTTYIQDPRAAMPGTRMVFAGGTDPTEIADLIAYLQQFDAAGNKK